VLLRTVLIRTVLISTSMIFCKNTGNFIGGFYWRILLEDSKDPTKYPPVPSDYKTRQLCRVKLSGASSSWVPFSINESEEHFVNNWPKWNTDLIKCPPGELYPSKEEPWTRATDLEKKNSNKPTKEWGDKKDVDNYNKKIGEMAESVVKLAMEREVRGKPGLLVCGFKLKEYLTRRGGNEEGDQVQPTLCSLPHEIEHDSAMFLPNFDVLHVTVIQVKSIQDPTSEKI